jgi:hypothetical protein
MSWTVGTRFWRASAMLVLSLPATLRETQHGFARPKREHGSRTPKLRTKHLTADHSHSGNNDLSATEKIEGTP